MSQTPEPQTKGATGHVFYLVSALVERPGKMGHRARVHHFASKEEAIGSSLELWQVDGWSVVSYDCTLCETLMESVAAKPEKYLVGDNTMDRVFKRAGLTNIHDLQAVFDAIEVALTPPPKSRAYEAGYGDARADAIYNLDLAIRDIEAGEPAVERLQQVREQIKTEDMPASGDMG